ncbi:ParA family protein [Corynebacterium kutscheri]|uniref:ATPase involved in chromosome partitioning n=1 Tax=Corynebacterium kutscheri TaxID=35755 RepID=A0A0F6R3F6_9CORY|nr:AAA family ATPase [Corynebacterium kutscheri]AKE42288.1 ATPase involved in chromosome partitioning [Corynebacterium kutscheri]VEH05602.1 Chromosome partitioning protein parA [Corynebacterium kutscheri]VEH10632.1 Chromosome partitioning protein parA [Corynebacterium kutscheri]
MEEHDWDDTPIATAARRAAQVLTPNSLHLPRPQRTRMVSISNQKGGVGKTTTSVNIAAGLAINGLKVLVIDIDPQGNASTALDIQHHVGTPSIYEVLIGTKTIEEVIQQSSVNENLYCVPATIDLTGAEIDLMSMVRREYRLADALNAPFIKEAQFDYIFIDCPPSLGLLNLNAMTAVEEVLIPIQCEYYALEGVGQLLNSITQIHKQLNPNLHVSAILLTMYDGRTKLSEQVVQEVRGHFKELVLKNKIPRSIRVSEAPGYSKPVLTYDAGSPGSVAYMDAARELALRGDYRPLDSSEIIGVAPEKVMEENVAQESEAN